MNHNILKQRRNMSRNGVIACSFLGILIIWMLTGLFSCKPKALHSTDVMVNGLFRVRVQELQPELVSQEIILNGKTAPARRVKLRSEIESKVVSLGAKRGDYVAEGEVIMILDEKDLRFRLREAEALLQQRTLENKAAENLFNKQLHSEMKVAESKSTLENARAAVEKTSINLKNTEILAPFGGMLQARYVEVGDYLSVGQPIAEIIETDPLIISAQVSERQIHEIHPGMVGIGKLTSGQQLEGVVRYIAPESESKCRTFTVELEVPNPDHKISAGETVQMVLSPPPVEAYKVPVSALVLDDEGVLGVKTVDQHDFVHFVPAKIMKSTNQGTWVTGVSEKARVIIVGQNYVQDNEQVAVDEQKPLPATSK